MVVDAPPRAGGLYGFTSNRAKHDLQTAITCSLSAVTIWMSCDAHTGHTLGNVGIDGMEDVTLSATDVLTRIKSDGCQAVRVASGSKRRRHRANGPSAR